MTRPLMMKVEIRRTADGSDTLYRPDLDEHYHSTFGAVRESQHVFIEAGLQYSLDKQPRETGSTLPVLQILEAGFGTGLNALLSQAEAERSGRTLHYTSVEAYPLGEETWRSLNYPHRFGSLDYAQVFNNIHQSAWDSPVQISPHFILHKVHRRLEDYQPGAGVIDLVFFDAFGPDVQPELWGRDVFDKLGRSMRRNGILVTYSVKGTVVRTLESSGFSIEKLPGPPGKRHILRATKLDEHL